MALYNVQLQSRVVAANSAADAVREFWTHINWSFWEVSLAERDAGVEYIAMNEIAVLPDLGKLGVEYRRLKEKNEYLTAENERLTARLGKIEAERRKNGGRNSEEGQPSVDGSPEGEAGGELGEGEETEDCQGCKHVKPELRHIWHRSICPYTNPLADSEEEAG